MFLSLKKVSWQLPLLEHRCSAKALMEIDPFEAAAWLPENYPGSFSPPISP